MVHQTFRFTAGPGVPTPITLPSVLTDTNGNQVTGCRRVTIRPNRDLPVDYDVFAPTALSPSFRRIAGEPHVFDPGMDQKFALPFLSGQTIGYVQPATVTIDYSGLCE